MVNVRVSDLLSKAKELSDDGYEFVELTFSDPDPEIEFPGGISFLAYGDTPGMMVNYDDVEHVEVEWYEE